ncbi:hypothetical protein SS50377_22702 [Spironucleus salmonicida]|uniref:Uncharacterized protein n=1 Tax=Spironucleus salmonicida TaxID=348837 RepID=A0A9P8LVI3_9EUKA|nr:hypothetical protein SS50377_22702 [Spironucleus salmonicida]
MKQNFISFADITKFSLNFNFPLQMQNHKIHQFQLADNHEVTSDIAKLVPTYASRLCDSSDISFQIYYSFPLTSCTAQASRTCKMVMDAIRRVDEFWKNQNAISAKNQDWRIRYGTELMEENQNWKLSQKERHKAVLVRSGFVS